MTDKYIKNRYKKRFSKKLKIIVVVVSTLLAVKLSFSAGAVLSSVNRDMIKYTDVEVYKNAFNNSIPLIDIVYNSGNTGGSFSHDLKFMVQNIFGFDIDYPLTILNANSTILQSYYKNSYLPDEGQKPEYADQYARNAPINGMSSRSETEGVRYDAKTDESGGAVDPKGSDSGGIGEGSSAGENRQRTPQDIFTGEGKVLIQQMEGTNYKIDIEALLSEPLNLNFEKKGPKALIYHTHTTEGYLKNLSELNKEGIKDRTDDARYNVLRVGEELAKYLKQYEIGTIHNGTNHIEKTDIGCYERSYDTITNILKGNQSIKLAFDLHRDALGSDKKFRPVANINGRDTAQIMFVVGTDKTLENKNWRENLKLAVKLQKYLEDNYPGITRPVYITKNRYNSHVSTGALVIEAGGNGNTIEEAVGSMKYLAEAINEVIYSN